MAALFDSIKRLFSREKAESGNDGGSWVAEFEAGDAGPFELAGGESYGASLRDGTLALDLRRRDLFAWTEARELEHADCAIEAEFEFGPGCPHAACGLLLRVANESNFYSLMVSNRGFARMDAVFNGNPRPVFGWTECGRAGAEDGAAGGEPGDFRLEAFSLRVIARGTHFLVFVDGEWVAEAEDDSFRSGHAAFAAQNYGEGDSASFLLGTCLVESRAVEVEAWYFRYNYYELAAPEARLRLARTYAAMGEWLKAAVQLRRIERRKALGVEELFLKAEISIRLELLDEAEEAIDAGLALEPANAGMAVEKANILYLRGDSLALRDWLKGLLEKEPDSARLLALSGHARFGLGDYLGAARDYGRAAAAEPGQPILRMNEARSREHAGDRVGAAAAYLLAAKGFFEAEADDDLALAMARIEELDGRNPELSGIRAKLLFRQGRKREAKAAIEALLKAGTRDSALHYLSGLLLREEGKTGMALERFEAALALEPDYPLYAFRRAETLFLMGSPEAEEAIREAQSLAPEDGWTCNLAAQAILARAASAGPAGGGDQAMDESPLPETEAVEARRLLGLAGAALPGAVEVKVNLAELESLLGRTEEALRALETFPEPAAHNEAGNVLARAGRLEEATAEYSKAISGEPGNAEYRCNLAATCLELERWTDAEEALRKALELELSPRACLLAANLALVYGDWVRAETSCRIGLEAAPEDADLLFVLGRSYLTGRKTAKANEAADKLGAIAPARGARLKAEILEATTESLGCATCGRAWRVPRNLPAQSGSSIRAMPPDDSPAGACPRCGKIYCIACRKGELAESRFTCPDCGDFLKLGDHRLKWLVLESLRRSDAANQ